MEIKHDERLQISFVGEDEIELFYEWLTASIEISNKIGFKRQLHKCKPLLEALHENLIPDEDSED